MLCSYYTKLIEKSTDLVLENFYNFKINNHNNNKNGGGKMLPFSSEKNLKIYIYPEKYLSFFSKFWQNLQFCVKTVTT